ncbi:MAG: 16S rRNA (guanine(527)-N(7))-methyltransferase RsmG [Acidobacteria bacterium]|nr:16S rRNA (guanine(527)-N(7))-methyltransferase RsmG [Acidobacteriota bacterium]
MFSHFELLRLWNRRLNLTSIRDDREIVVRHYCESLFLAGALPVGPLRVVDVGSGAGFPGIPLAIVRVDVSVCLVESHQRKAVFLREASRSFGNVRVFSGRAEDLGEGFDWCVSRGVSATDLAVVVGALAERFAVLAGEEFFPAAISGQRIRLPWGDRRFLHVGSVPRGTSRSTMTP